jgi:eukaryotic-like serine/threonine-protein kinase
MPLAPGDKLGPYEILALIGAGGMGEVYRAHDPRMGRDVAIKISAERFSDRFSREVHAVAALNHPNICTIYDVVISKDAPNYLVMEYIEGESPQGPLPLDDALRFAAQIAEALGAAHDKGIVHRDLKPANIKIKPGGMVKVLDFGLAKLTPAEAGATTENSPTLTMGPTQAGMILGTAPYMSPEQARGKPVDKRADIWAFGVVLDEMLTGRRLFQGETVTDTLAAVVMKTPDWERAPVQVRRLLKACLEKEAKNRLQAIADWRLLLDDAQVGQVSDLPSHVGQAPGLPWVVAAAVALALAAVSFIHFREKPPIEEMVRLEISAPADTTFLDDSSPVVSPDGRKIAFVAVGADRKSMIWIRPLDIEESRPLVGTEGAGFALFWSPDSRSLAFMSGGKLKKIEATGGPAQTLCDAPTAFNGVWTSDNRILFGGSTPLQVVSASGGTPTPLTTVAHQFPAMLPDGHHFVYSRLQENVGVYVGSLDAGPEQQGARKLLSDDTPAVYVPAPGTHDTPGDAPGFLLFVRGLTRSSPDAGTLMAQPFDPKRMEFTGDAVPIAEHVGFGGFSASPTGVLAFSTAVTQAPSSQLTWVDRKGAVLSTAGEVGEYSDLALSPDAARVAYVRGHDLWLFEFARGGVNTKFTFGSRASGPAWSTDGSRVVFVSTRESGYGIYRKASNSSGQEDLLYQSPEPKSRPNLTRDGRFLLYDGPSSEGKNHVDLWILPSGDSVADRNPLPFLHTEFSEFDGRFSPDGRWVAYVSSQSGKNEVYVLPFDESNPGSPAAGGLHQVSQDGGSQVHWRADGKELFYRGPDGYLMSVAVNVAGSAFQTGTPQRLFKSPSTGGATWDVSKDGKQILIAAPPSSSASAPASRPYHVVVNWTGLLKR